MPTKYVYADHNESNPYLCVSRDVIQNNDLSEDARLALLFVLSKPDGWDISAEKIANDLDWWHERAKNVLRELEEAGHLNKVEKRNVKGQFKYYFYVYEHPSDNPHFHPDDRESELAGEASSEERASRNSTPDLFENDAQEKNDSDGSEKKNTPTHKDRANPESPAQKDLHLNGNVREITPPGRYIFFTKPPFYGSHPTSGLRRSAQWTAVQKKLTESAISRDPPDVRVTAVGSADRRLPDVRNPDDNESKGNESKGLTNTSALYLRIKRHSYGVKESRRQNERSKHTSARRGYIRAGENPRSSFFSLSSPSLTGQPHPNIRSLQSAECQPPVAHLNGNDYPSTLSLRTDPEQMSHSGEHDSNGTSGKTRKDVFHELIPPLMQSVAGKQVSPEEAESLHEAFAREVRQKSDTNVHPGTITESDRGRAQDWSVESPEAAMHLRRLRDGEYERHLGTIVEDEYKPGRPTWPIRIYEMVFPSADLSTRQKREIDRAVRSEVAYPVPRAWGEVLYAAMIGEWNPSNIQPKLEEYRKKRDTYDPSSDLPGKARYGDDPKQR